MSAPAPDREAVVSARRRVADQVTVCSHDLTRLTDDLNALLRVLTVPEEKPPAPPVPRPQLVPEDHREQLKAAAQAAGGVIRPEPYRRTPQPERQAGPVRRGGWWLADHFVNIALTVALLVITGWFLVMIVQALQIGPTL